MNVLRNICCAVVLAGCGPHTTPCGSIVDFTQRPDWYVDVDKVESLSLVSFALYSRDERLSRVGHACHKLEGVRIVAEVIPLIVDLDAGTSTQNGGLADIWRNVITLHVGEPGNTIPLNKSAYTHEIAHIIQGGDGLRPPECREWKDKIWCDDQAHSGWFRDGVFAAIDYVQSK